MDYNFIPCSGTMRETVDNLMMGNQEHVDGTSTNVDPTFDQGFAEDADIGGFLERPVLIRTFTWNVASSFNQSFNPWSLFLSNPAVRDKINNYHLLRGTLKVTFMINGTPQHAGLLLASYSFLAQSNEAFTLGGDTQIVTRSQRPHVFLNPSLSRGGCLCLPFFWGNNFIDLQTTNVSLGNINIDSFQPLTQLNAATDAVSVSVFAHMTDVVLTVPTLNAVAISGRTSKKVSMTTNDEYSRDGPVSSVANAVANAAGAMTPVLGPFALATQIGARAVGSIAALFGFSKPVEIRDAAFMRNAPLHSMATADGSDLSQKLSVTRKQELTIDPNTVGLSSHGDELDVRYLASIESYIAQFPWLTTQVANSWLFSISVIPNHFRQSGTQVIPTISSYVSRPFGEWSGTIKFRFKIVASRFTRGRLAFVYEPTSSINTTSDTYNTNYTVIVDISETRDFTVEIPWMQAEPYKELDHFTGNLWSNDALTTGLGNGVLGVRVLNELVQPDGITDVSVNVFVSTGEDFEVVNPTGYLMDKMSFVPASAMEFIPVSGVDENSDDIKDSEDEPEQTSSEVMGKPLPTVDYKSLVFYGERVGSLRQLLKRFVYYRSVIVRPGTLPVSGYVTSFVNLSSFPAYRQEGVPTDITSGATTYLHYAARMYAAWRGGIRYKILTTGQFADISAERFVGRSNVYAPGTSTSLTSTDTSAIMTTKQQASFAAALSGIGLTDGKVMPVLEYEVPYANPFRFSKSSTTNLNAASSFYSYGSTHRLQWATRFVDEGAYGVNLFVAAGDDFQVFGFIGAPVYYQEI